VKEKAPAYVQAVLQCHRCARKWDAVDVNANLEVVKCPVCGAPNDILEAVKRAKENQ